ncbi:FAD-dependent oxidoreductase [Chitinophaga horti]|uniref:FAD-dependent oxidoreductase n=1 Tax=Chitinophaga horti TaxID=2920382 RepID=A0ABY6IYL2_9BACT|nr:FAD-dependent oxidoreductase [Chitinophaga horti]UYQ92493.1 FAD-dependent oxidoreductase [Chitinophaga horti]
MRRFVAAFLCLGITAQANAQDHKADIIVYGGSSAGVIAAYTAKMQGKSVLLIEPGKHLGGLSSGGLGYTDIGNKYAVRGLGLDFYRRLGKVYGKLEQWIFEPHTAEAVFNDYIKRGKVPVWYGHRILKADKVNGTIKSITVEDASGANKVIAGKVFIDCTYEGDLMARAGVSYTVGREANSEYGETFNGVQLMDGHQIPDHVDPYKVLGDSTSGLLWGISPEPLAATGSGDKKVQAYNYRICLTTDPANRIPITQPANYDASRYDLLARLIVAQPKRRNINDYFIISGMPNKKTDINNRNGFSTDMIGMNYDYPEADYAKRAEIIKAHEDYTKGLLYFFTSDERVPESMRKDMSRFGYPKDEYTDNGGWSPQLYIREARRMRGAYVMKQDNCVGKEPVTDGVGMAAYTMDSHNTQRIVITKNGKKMVKNEGNVEEGGFPPYPISYRSLVPQQQECSNLLVPVCLSATHIAYGSIRMEPVFMCLAQASTLAACQSIDRKIPVQQVDAAAIRRSIEQNPLSDGSRADIFIDNKDNVKVSGDWTSAHPYGAYGPDILLNTTGKGSVKFIPNVPKAGDYKVFIYYPKMDKSASMTNYIVNGKAGLKKGAIDRSAVRVEGQTSGEWVEVGAFAFAKGQSNYIEITADGADGGVAADAVLMVPK